MGPSIRWPKGYVGRGHEALGSDVLSVQKTLLLPGAILGHENVTRLQQVKADDWYPVDWLLKLMDDNRPVCRRLRFEANGTPPLPALSRGAHAKESQVRARPRLRAR